MNGGIFLIQTGGELVEMTEQPYDTEAVLQELLARYPSLLAGDQMAPAAPRRWLLVSREAGVPGEADGGDRWAVDHLFLDQDAIPTLVEVKRSKDTRIRREVVGQMLDYAANAVAYWPVEGVRARFEEGCRQRGVDPAKEVETLAGQGDGADGFWQRVKTNLQAGRVRMVFVADVIPPELRRVVEFLNGQMDPAEVLAVEIRQFVGQGLKTLVPRVIGQTAEAERKKGGPSPKSQKSDAAAFLAEMAGSQGAAVGESARRVVEWAEGNGCDLNFTRGQSGGMFSLGVRTPAGTRSPLAAHTNGDVWFQMRWLREGAPFNDPAKREELRGRLNAIPGVNLSPDRMTGYPSIPLAKLADAALGQFLGVVAWVVAELRAVPG